MRKSRIKGIRHKAASRRAKVKESICGKMNPSDGTVRRWETVNCPPCLKHWGR